MQASFMDGPNGRLAYMSTTPMSAAGQNAGTQPGVVWLGGFASDMTGSKAAFMHDWAEREARAFVRFDYSGHGASDGAFEAGCISDWFADACAIFDRLTTGPQILVGSSMGGWIALLLAKARPERTRALVLIAPAPDFTEDLLWANMSAADRDTLMREGRLEKPSPYGDAPTVYTRKLVEDGRRNLLLNRPFSFAGPVRILQGMADEDVPWRHAMRLAETIDAEDLEARLIKNGDHRLSTPADLARLERTVAEIA